MILVSVVGLILWILAFNIVGMIMMMLDKKRAQRHMYRIPEKRLMWMGFLGGAPLMLITMYLIHHKTHRKKFTIGFPIAIVCMIAVIVLMWYDNEHFVFHWTSFSPNI